jgi:hypothetical protein
MIIKLSGDTMPPEKLEAIQDESARETARALMNVIEGILRDDEKRECFQAMKGLVHAGIEAYEERRRLLAKPPEQPLSRN